MTVRRKEQAGLIVYFDTWLPVLDDFTPEEIGMLFSAMLIYGKFGNETEFADRAMRQKWHDIKRAVDRDKDSYAEKCRKSQYAAYCREHTENTLDYDTWQRMTSDDVERHHLQPTTTTTPIPSTTPISTTTPIPSTTTLSTERKREKENRGTGEEVKTAAVISDGFSMPNVKPLSAMEFENMRTAQLNRLYANIGNSN